MGEKWGEIPICHSPIFSISGSKILPTFPFLKISSPHSPMDKRGFLPPMGTASASVAAVAVICATGAGYKLLPRASHAARSHSAVPPPAGQGADGRPTSRAQTEWTAHFLAVSSTWAQTYCQRTALKAVHALSAQLLEDEHPNRLPRIFFCSLVCSSCTARGVRQWLNGLVLCVGKCKRHGTDFLSNRWANGSRLCPIAAHLLTYLCRRLRPCPWGCGRSRLWGST